MRDLSLSETFDLVRQAIGLAKGDAIQVSTIVNVPPLDHTSPNNIHKPLNDIRKALDDPNAAERVTDQDLIKQTKAKLKEQGVSFGDFWEIVRSPGSVTRVWFWGDPPGEPNYACTFDEQAGTLVSCNAENKPKGARIGHLRTV